MSATFFLRYCSGVSINDAEAQQKIMPRIFEVESAVYSCGASVLAVRVGRVGRLWFSRLIEESNIQGVLMKVPDAIGMKWLMFSVLRLTDRMDVDFTLAFVPVALL